MRLGLLAALRRQQPELVGPPHGLGAIADAELAEDRGGVLLDGVGREPELGARSRGWSPRSRTPRAPRARAGRRDPARCAGGDARAARLARAAARAVHGVGEPLARPPLAARRRRRRPRAARRASSLVVAHQQRPQPGLGATSARLSAGSPTSATSGASRSAAASASSASRAPLQPSTHGRPCSASSTPARRTSSASATSTRSRAPAGALVDRVLDAVVGRARRGAARRARRRRGWARRACRRARACGA